MGELMLCAELKPTPVSLQVAEWLGRRLKRPYMRKFIPTESDLQVRTPSFWLKRIAGAPIRIVQYIQIGPYGLPGGGGGGLWSGHDLFLWPCLKCRHTVRAVTRHHMPPVAPCNATLATRALTFERSSMVPLRWLFVA